MTPEQHIAFLEQQLHALRDHYAATLDYLQFSARIDGLRESKHAAQIGMIVRLFERVAAEVPEFDLAAFMAKAPEIKEIGAITKAIETAHGDFSTDQERKAQEKAAKAQQTPSAAPADEAADAAPKPKDLDPVLLAALEMEVDLT